MSSLLEWLKFAPIKPRLPEDENTRLHPVNTDIHTEKLNIVSSNGEHETVNAGN